GAEASLVRMRPFGGLNALGRIRSILFELRFPVGITDGAVLRQLVFAWSSNALEERALRTFQTHQIVRAEETFVQHAALVFAEVVVLPRNQNVVALQQAPGNERHLLRIE